ncbi:MAG: HD domain-containing protein [Lachnospiraceae bacterium]|nr:HD domain-containing protein [Lachnospiraceae bacterium]
MVSILYTVQIIWILIPVSGILALLYRRRQSENSIHLMLTNIGCLIMNSGYLLLLDAGTKREALLAFRIEYLGNVLFYLFFVVFLLSYLNLKVPMLMVYGWAVLEGAVFFVYWNERLKDMWLGGLLTEKMEELGIYYISVGKDVLNQIRYSILCTVLLLGLVYTVKKMVKTRLDTERKNLMKLAGAQFVIIVSLIVQLMVHPFIDVVPFFASVSILSIIIGVMKDEFYGVTDSGHDWAFQQMEDAFLIVDYEYRYLDANDSARNLFPELAGMDRDERISGEIRQIFAGSGAEMMLNGRYYEKKVTEIRHNRDIVGFGILLRDVTRQKQYMELMDRFNEQLQKEVEEKTEHIRVVQDSIITGMASMVESRDNSTGGHISRTSLVIKEFADKLLENREKLHIDREFVVNLVKAAPMHDLGKIAVDDVILRKPGRFTDEEFAKMKAHAAEGAEMVGKVLQEIDDERFKKIAVNVAHYHHERWDGSGYPNRISGEEIPLEARIMALADVFDALVSKRCYKDAFSYDDAFRIIEEGLGTFSDGDGGCTVADGSRDVRGDEFVLRNVLPVQLRGGFHRRQEPCDSADGFQLRAFFCHFLHDVPVCL